MSSLTWLDYSEAERARALQVVELLSQPETRDELGLAAIRDAFAGAMFPGMSTVQRRAKYFLFVPWIFREEERRHAGRSDAVELTRRHELRLIETLLNSGETEGVIGGRARKNLRQVASLIYWNGLREWGIRTKKGTREQWGREVARGQVVGVDDDGQTVHGGGSWWHSGLPEPPSDWPSEASFELRVGDADYLRSRIRARCEGTLLATLAERTEPWAEVTFAWELSLPELPERQGRLLQHARRFSETMYGAALLYNHQLAVEHEDEERELQYRADLEEWGAREVAADRSQTPLDEMWVLLAEIGARHTERTHNFVTEWFVGTQDPTQAVNDAGLLELIKRRELDVKGRQARLTFDAARETWRGAAGASQLGYRWSSAQRQLLDIVGAGESDA